MNGIEDFYSIDKSLCLEYNCKVEMTTVPNDNLLKKSKLTERKLIKDYSEISLEKTTTCGAESIGAG